MQDIKLKVIFSKSLQEDKTVLVDYEAIQPEQIETVAIYDTAFFQTKRYYVIRIQDKKFVLTNSSTGWDGYKYVFDLGNILEQDIGRFRQLGPNIIKIYNFKELVNLNITPQNLEKAFWKSEKLHNLAIAAHDVNFLQISEEPTSPQPVKS